MQRDQRLRQHEQHAGAEGVEEQTAREQQVGGCRGGIRRRDQYQQHLPGQVDAEPPHGGPAQLVRRRQPVDDGEEQDQRQDGAGHREQGEQRVGDAEPLVDDHLPEGAVDEGDGGEDRGDQQCEERAPGVDDQAQHRAVTGQSLAQWDAAVLLAPDDAHPRLGGELVEHQQLHEHEERGVEVEDADGGHQAELRHHQRGDRGEQGGQVGGDLDQRVHLRDRLAIDILHEEAVPRVLRHLPGAVDDRRDEEPPEVLRERPHQARDDERDEVGHRGGQATAELVGDRA